LSLERPRAAGDHSDGGGDARGDHGVGGVDYGVCDKALLQGIESVLCKST
jgi:hypothetical protein